MAGTVQQGGNAGSLLGGEAIDVRSWLLGLGTRRVTSTLDGIYTAAEEGMAKTLPADLSVWSSLNSSSVDFGAGSVFNGSITNILVGVEMGIMPNLVLGIAVGGYEGDIDYNNGSLRIDGNLDLTGLNLNPYMLWSVEGARVWATLGLGEGDLNYTDTIRAEESMIWPAKDSSSLSSIMVGAGAEIDLMANDFLEVLGRFELVSMQVETGAGKGSLYNKQNVDIHGVRGEVEVGWPTEMTKGGTLRPYITAGYRRDGGDGDGSNSIEVGAGLAMQTQHFTFNGSLRTQANSNAGDYEQTSYNLAFSYDRNSDSRGLMLTLSQSIDLSTTTNAFAASAQAVPGLGSVAQLTPASQGSANQLAYAGQGSSQTRSSNTINVEAGYGLALGSMNGDGAQGDWGGMLTFKVSTDFNEGVMGVQTYGLMLESGKAAASAETDSFISLVRPGRYELQFTKTPGLGGSDDVNAIQLKLSREL